jgi:hypothetical protein
VSALVDFRLAICQLNCTIHPANCCFGPFLSFLLRIRHAQAGHDVLQRLPDTAARLPNRCGPEIPVSDLIACCWSKTNNAAAQFPNYARRLRKLDQQGAIDNVATFFLMVEEWEILSI